MNSPLSPSLPVAAHIQRDLLRCQRRGPFGEGPLTALRIALCGYSVTGSIGERWLLSAPLSHSEREAVFSWRKRSAARVIAMRRACPSRLFVRDGAIAEPIVARPVGITRW